MRLKKSILLASIAVAMHLISVTSHAQSQTSIGYVNLSGDWILTASASTLETAFTDELDDGSNSALYNATFTSVSIINISGTRYLVAEGSNLTLQSIVVRVQLDNPSNQIFLDDDHLTICNCPDGLCGSDCPATGMCPCSTGTANLVGGANHLGTFY